MISMKPSPNDGKTVAASGELLTLRTIVAARNAVKRNVIVSRSGTRIVETTLGQGVAATKTLDLTYYDEASTFFR